MRATPNRAAWSTLSRNGRYPQRPVAAHHPDVLLGFIPYRNRTTGGDGTGNSGGTLGAALDAPPAGG
jgi:hypothetical protein